MLVLKRRIDESICIGNTIEVKILGRDGATIKLGISAPPDIPVHRKEIAELIQRQAEKGARKQNGGA